MLLRRDIFIYCVCHYNDNNFIYTPKSASKTSYSNIRLQTCSSGREIRNNNKARHIHAR